MTTSAIDPALRSLLYWYAEMGALDGVSDAADGLYAWSEPRRPAFAPEPGLTPAPIRTTPPKAVPVDEAIGAAETAARRAETAEALAAAVAAFEGCALKAGARSTVFTDGVYGAELLVIGEAPGRDEDLAGRPFVGRAGQLLDRMLAAIGRRRSENTLITNVVFWRPPGNRTPTQLEIAVCKPFVERLIELTRPKAVMLAGGVPTQALLLLPGVTRARGQWRPLTTASGFSAPALPIFHPAFLLRQPAQKRLAWADLLSVEARLRGD